MPLFIVLVVGAMLCGAGAMLSPSLPTSQPRIGLAATFTLALIIGGSLFMLSLTNHDSIVIDYVLFALLSGTVLGGTISQAQTRAEEKGEELSDADQGWTGPQDLLFFTLVGLIFIGLLLVVKPAQVGSFSAGSEMLVGYVSKQLQQTHPIAQRAIGAILGFLAVWIIYDLGSEWRGKPLGRAMAVAALPVFAALYAGGHFVVLMGVMFAAAYLIFLMRALYTGQRLDILGAGLMLGACLLASADTFALAVVASAVWSPLVQRSVKPALERTPTRRFVWAIPLIAVVAALPWWITNIEAIGSGLYEMVRMPESVILLALALVLPLSLGWGLWSVWRSLSLDLRASLRRSYYGMAVVIGIVLVVGIAILN